MNKPISCASKKIGLYWVDTCNGKQALTEFQRISFNGKSSLVKCFPKTGRTHQIRIHLQFLGYPISNDPLYNQPILWGPSNGKNGVYEFKKDEIEQNFSKIHTFEAWIIKHEEDLETTEKSALDVIKTKRKNSYDEKLECKKQKSEKNTNLISNEQICEIDSNLPSFEISKFIKDNECFECKQIYRDPVRSEMTMYLHALSYKVYKIFKM